MLWPFHRKHDRDERDHVPTVEEILEQADDVLEQLNAMADRNEERLGAKQDEETRGDR